VNAESLRFVAQANKTIRCPFSVVLVETFGKFVLCAPFESVASLALELDIQLVESRGHLLPYHEMTSVRAFVMAQASASEALSPPFIVDGTKPDELREYLVKLRFRLCYCHSFRVSRRGCSSCAIRAWLVRDRILSPSLGLVLLDLWSCVVAQGLRLVLLRA